MGRSSTLKTIGSPFFCGMTTGTISSAVAPLAMAARARWWLMKETRPAPAGDLVELRDILGRVPHVVVVEELPEAVIDHEVRHGAVGHVHPVAPPGVGQ